MALMPVDYRDRKVCVLGLGYVGLTLATVMAEVGYDVLGVEIRDDVLELLRSGVPHFYEPGLAERLRKVVASGRLRVVKRIPEDCRASVHIVTVGTPLDSQGVVRLDMIRNVTSEIAQHLRGGELVIMRSTVKLGTTKTTVLPLLRESGQDFDLAFCPERTIEGNALRELRELPQIVGGIDLKSQLRAAQLFQFLTPTIVRVSDIETAEMIKMVDNSYRDVCFAYANEIARICDAVGISAVEVINSGKLGYPRVNLPLPGPVGGPCLSKDPYILQQSLAGTSLRPEITLAARSVNESQPDESIAAVRRVLAHRPDWPEEPVIVLMGVAFKGRPATNDLRGTMAVPIFEAVKKYFPKARYKGFDAMVSAEDMRAFGLEPCPSLPDAMTGANLALILNNHKIFADMPLEDLAAVMARPGLVYDYWNHFTAASLALPSGVGYMALGSHGKAILP